MKGCLEGKETASDIQIIYSIHHNVLQEATAYMKT